MASGRLRISVIRCLCSIKKKAKGRMIKIYFLYDVNFCSSMSSRFLEPFSPVTDLLTQHSLELETLYRYKSDLELESSNDTRVGESLPSRETNKEEEIVGRK